MHRESSIERRGNLALARHGWEVVKVGFAGYPDRIAIKEKHYFWLEYKTPDGRLTAAQKRRIPKLRKKGHEVLVIDNAERLEKALDYGYYPFVRGF